MHVKLDLPHKSGFQKVFKNHDPVLYDLKYRNKYCRYDIFIHIVSFIYIVIMLYVYIYLICVIPSGTRLIWPLELFPKSPLQGQHQVRTSWYIGCQNYPNCSIHGARAAPVVVRCQKFCGFQTEHCFARFFSTHHHFFVWNPRKHPSPSKNPNKNLNDDII